MQYDQVDAHDVNIYLANQHHGYGGSGWSDGGYYDGYAMYPSRVHQGSVQYAGAAAEIGDEMVGDEAQLEDAEDDNPLTADDMFGYKEVTIIPHLDASAEQLAKDPRLAVWRPSKDNLRAMRHNTRTADRKNAKDEELFGDLAKATILGAEVVSYTSHTAFPLGVEIPIMVSNQMYDSKNFNYVLPPNAGTQTKVNESIYDPNYAFSKRYYKSLNKCNMSSLNDQIRFDNKTENHAEVDVSGFVWGVIQQNIGEQEHWRDFHDEFWEIEQKRRMGDLHGRFVDVPRPIAEEVHKSVAQEIAKIEKSLVDLRKLEVRFVRPGGEAWNDVNGFIGDAAAWDDKSKLRLQDHVLNKPNYANVAIKLKYFLNP
jgi:hypothetical protein